MNAAIATRRALRSGMLFGQSMPSHEGKAKTAVEGQRAYVRILKEIAVRNRSLE